MVIKWGLGRVIFLGPESKKEPEGKRGPELTDCAQGTNEMTR